MRQDGRFSLEPQAASGTLLALTQSRMFIRYRQNMKLSWHFSKVNPRFKNREATQGEFFANDTELRAFVREAVQNSLDARRPGYTGPVSVRIFVSGSKSALTIDASKRYFKGGWDEWHCRDYKLL
ncbi:MAG: hypothetical protein WKF77_00375, partial [Planctomycetaceae bacterium]